MVVTFKQIMEWIRANEENKHADEIREWLERKKRMHNQLKGWNEEMDAIRIKQITFVENCLKVLVDAEN